MKELQAFCRVATTFTKNAESLDEDAFREWLQRFVDSKIGIYLNSGGGGESQALTWEEMQRIYKIGVAECRGKIPVNGNPPEQYTSKLTREYTMQAIEAGCDMVSIYALASRHSMKPTDAELTQYLDEVLTGVHHPLSLAVNPSTMGHTPKPAVIADACNRHHQVEALNLSFANDNYFVQIKDRLKRDIPIYVHVFGSLNKLTMGAKGIFGTESNILPKTQVRYLEAYENKDYASLGKTYADLLHFVDFTVRWTPSVARWIKMSMRLLKLPGGEGGLRPPYCMPPEEEYKIFADGLLRLGIPEIEEQARAAGLKLPTSAK